MNCDTKTQLILISQSKYKKENEVEGYFLKVKKYKKLSKQSRMMFFHQSFQLISLGCFTYTYIYLLFLFENTKLSAWEVYLSDLNWRQFMKNYLSINFCTWYCCFLYTGKSSTENASRCIVLKINKVW